MNVLSANRRLITFVSSRVIIGNIVLTGGLIVNKGNMIPSGKEGPVPKLWSIGYKIPDVACQPIGSVADDARVTGGKELHQRVAVVGSGVLL